MAGERGRHAQRVKNGASSPKTNYIDIFSAFLNLEENQKRKIGSKLGGVASGRVCGLFLRPLIGRHMT